MKRKNANFPKGVQKVLLLLLMSSAAKMGLHADPVWAIIVATNFEERYHQYFIDKTGDGIEDGVIRVRASGDTFSLFRRYMPVGSRVLYENDGKDEFAISSFQILRIEMPDGRTIRVNDFAGQYSNYYRARDYEAQQAAEAQKQGR